jgi:putative SOS response-associated peptidase YedK
VSRLLLPAEAIARIFGTANLLPNLAPSWNVAPTQNAAVVRRHRETGARRACCACSTTIFGLLT